MANKSIGSALLSALFMMTLIAIAATAMSVRMQFDIYRAQTTFDSERVYLASELVPFWAMSALSAKKLTFLTNQPNGKLLEFPKAMQADYPDIQIQGTLYDLQARFNINNIFSEPYRANLGRLLKELGRLSPQEQAQLQTYSLHWLRPYDLESGEDVMGQIYLQQKPPYLPAHQPLKSVSEYRLVSGISDKLYEKLSPCIIALPEVTPINLMTAAPEVLKTVGNGLTDTEVNTVIEARKANKLRNSTELNQLISKLHLPSAQITTESKYYLAVGTVSMNTLALTTYSIIKRGKNDQGKWVVSLVSESINTL